MMNLETLDWDEDILSILGIPRAMLPKIVPSSDPQTWGCTAKNGPLEKPSLFVAIWEINKQHWSGKLVLTPVKRRTLTAQAVLCC